MSESKSSKSKDSLGSSPISSSIRIPLLDIPNPLNSSFKGEYITCTLKRPRLSFNPRYLTKVVEVIVGVKTSEFRGRKYLWSVRKYPDEEREDDKMRIEFVAPEGAVLHLYFHYSKDNWTSYGYFIVSKGVKGTYQLSDGTEVNVENLILVKVPSDKEVEALLRNSGYALSKSRYRDHLVAARAYMIHKYYQTMKDKEKSRNKKNSLLEKLRCLAEELGKEEEKEEEEEKVAITKEDILQYLRNQGLVQVKLVTFDLPTEYKGAKTEYKKINGKVMEIKTFHVDPTVYRTLRRKFYNVLEKNAFKTTAGWVLLSKADINELNKVIAELNKLAGTSRCIWVIETYLPKDFIVNQLQQYIKSRELSLKDMVNKLKLKKLKEYQKKQLLKRIEVIQQVIANLKEELKNVSK